MAKNINSLQLLRSSRLYATKQAAVEALQALATGSTPTDLDGVAVLARYGEGANVKSVVGFGYQSGNTRTITIMDFDNTQIAAMQSEIDRIEDAVGLNANGSHAQSTGHYTSSATTIEGEIVALDAQVKANANAIDAMDKTASAVDGQVVTTVAQADGQVTETKANVKDLQLGGYAKDDAATGDIASTDTINTAFSKVENKLAATDGKIDALDATATTTSSQVFGEITQNNGLVAATPKLATSLVMEGLSATADTKIAAEDTLGQALAKLQGQIDSMDLSAVGAEGSVITSVSEADGKVSAAATPVKDVKLTGYVKDTTKTGDIAATDDIEDALSKLENKAAAITITNADGSINVATTTGGTDINVNIKSGEHVLAKAGNDGLYTDIKLSGVTPSSTAVKEEYSLIGTDGSVLGENIKIYKDSSVVSISYITDPSDKHYQNLEYTYIDASGITQTEYVDISSLVLEAEFASGVTVTDHVAHGVVDPTSEDFLTVGAAGFKVSGVQTAIDGAIEALDVTDAAVAGQYVSAVNETNGKVAMTRANVSDAVLNGYAKGSDATAIAASDTVNQALSKLENQVDAAKAAATTKVVEGTDAGNNLEITSATSSTDGSTTYTVNLTDVASKTALDAEIAARKAVDGQTGQTYAANSSAHYITAATSLNDADVKLDAQLKAEQDEIDAIETAVGLASDGRYVANTANTYTNDAQSVADAINKLDAQVKANADAIDQGSVVAGDGIEVTTVTGTGGTDTQVAVLLKDDIANTWENPLKFDTDGSLYFDAIDAGMF